MVTPPQEMQSSKQFVMTTAKLRDCISHPLLKQVIHVAKELVGMQVKLSQMTILNPCFAILLEKNVALAIVVDMQPDGLRKTMLAFNLYKFQKYAIQEQVPRSQIHFKAQLQMMLMSSIVMKLLSKESLLWLSSFLQLQLLCFNDIETSILKETI